MTSQISTSIFHGIQVLPSIKLKFSFEGTSTLPIINLDTNEKSQHNPINCHFKNKYGEFCCKQNYSNQSKLCKEHTEFLYKYRSNMVKILDIIEECKDNNYTLDSYMKCLLNFFNYCFKHKEKLVNFSLEKLEQIIVSKYYEHFCSLINEDIHDNLVIHSKSISFEKHINNLLKIEQKIKDLKIKKQIELSNHMLISNKIKIQKLSEIYIKINSDSFPVICKGIDSKILSFF
jgi:hypothetical protein